jgi:hypothetical protein
MLIVKKKSVSMNEEWWEPGDNEWATQHQFFEGNTSFTDINQYLANNKILVVKSCFPSSSIDAVGQPADTLDPYYKTIYNYKWHWRHIIKVMENHPENFFAIWTNAPLERASTNANEAALSKSFCKWAKDTLANGLDITYGAFPKNVYVFDFFNKLVDSEGFLPDNLRSSEGDSHPNGKATDLIAPQFVNEIFDAAIAYESPATDIATSLLPNPDVRIYSIPSTNRVTIELNNYQKRTTIDIMNSSGKKIRSFSFIPLMSKELIPVDLSGFSKGIYLIQIQSVNSVETKKVTVR